VDNKKAKIINSACGVDIELLIRNFSWTVMNFQEFIGIFKKLRNQKAKFKQS
jgi:hypothetical protein